MYTVVGDRSCQTLHSATGLIGVHLSFAWQLRLVSNAVAKSNKRLRIESEDEPRGFKNRDSESRRRTRYTVLYRVDFRPVFARYFSTIKAKTPLLPASIPLAKIDSRIQQVFNNIPADGPADEAFEVFDRRFNALYHEDLRDAATGRLPNFERGQHGLDLVITYLQSIVDGNPSGFQWNAGVPKLVRIAKEIKILMDLSATESRAPAVVPPPKPIPTALQSGKGATARSQPSARTTKAGDAKRGRGLESSAATAAGAPQPFTDSDDSDFVPSKRRRAGDDDDDDVMSVYGADGEEVVEETQIRIDLEKKRKERKRKAAEEEEDSDSLATQPSGGSAVRTSYSSAFSITGVLSVEKSTKGTTVVPERDRTCK
ncbi:hypothetical protein DFP72DRAFT_1093429 [Ephemerocybe angulata]|uniref:Uncharacterized protein n=1 Tax=Ephemerocybe angulata TaxID=980116 RepID=A0A8H6HCZ0_9AGAR|nr:hypothetical protein DFP72DRAFT_1093429 [Tulosesus angulatus]